jgi:hypothetical protein
VDPGASVAVGVAVGGGVAVAVGVGVAVGEGAAVSVGGRGVFAGGEDVGVRVGVGGASATVGGTGVAVGSAFPQPAIKVKTIITATLALKRIGMVLLPFAVQAHAGWRVGVKAGKADQVSFCSTMMVCPGIV